MERTTIKKATALVGLVVFRNKNHDGGYNFSCPLCEKVTDCFPLGGYLSISLLKDKTEPFYCGNCKAKFTLYSDRVEWDKEIPVVINMQKDSYDG